MSNDKKIVEVELTIPELENKYPITVKAINKVLSVKESEDGKTYSLESFPKDLKLKFSETQLYVANNFLNDLFYRKIAQVVLDGYDLIGDVDNPFDEFCVGDEKFSTWCETHVPGSGAANKILDSFYDGNLNEDLMSSILKKKKEKITKLKTNNKQGNDTVKKQARNVVDGELIGYVYEKDGKYIAISEDGKDLTSTVDNQSKLKYAFKHKGVVRGRLKDNNLVWRVVKEKFINSTYPTLEEIEEKITREENAEKVESIKE